MSLRALAQNPIVYIVGLFIAGASCIVTGTALLAGAGPAFVAAGIFAIGAAGFIRKGLSGNG